METLKKSKERNSIEPYETMAKQNKIWDDSCKWRKTITRDAPGQAKHLEMNASKNEQKLLT